MQEPNLSVSPDSVRAKHGHRASSRAKSRERGKVPLPRICRLCMSYKSPHGHSTIKDGTDTSTRQCPHVLGGIPLRAKAAASILQEPIMKSIKQLSLTANCLAKTTNTGGMTHWEPPPLPPHPLAEAPRSDKMIRWLNTLQLNTSKGFLKPEPVCLEAIRVARFLRHPGLSRNGLACLAASRSGA